MALPATTARQRSPQQPIRAPRVVYIGDRQSLDFQPARRRLAAESARGLCSFTDADDIVSAMDALARPQGSLLQAADVLVLAQLRPGELNAAEVNELRRRAPLAAMVVLCGAWCEGEARSGHPLPGISQVAWHQFAPRWIRHRTAWQQGRPAEWSLPATWREEERLLHLGSATELKSDPLVEVALVLPESEMHSDNWLISLANSRRWAVAASSQPDAARTATAIGVWQADELDAARLDELGQFVRQVQPIPVIAIVGFPRPEHDARIREIGAQALLARPLLVGDFLAEVAWILDERALAQR